MAMKWFSKALVVQSLFLFLTSALTQGIGIYVFDGDERGPTGTLPNNSFVISRPDDSDGFRLRFVCHSNQTGVGQILGTGGNPLSHSSRFNVSTSQRNQPGEVLVFNRNGGQLPITSVQQGVYTCNLPCLNGTLADLSIGIYPNSFDMEPPRIISLTFDTTTRSFTCTSTGSPATTVTWMRDGQSLTIDGGTYLLIQRVTNRRASTYENILTLTTVEDLGITRYECTVMNALGNSTRMFVRCPNLSNPVDGRVVSNNQTSSYTCNVGFRRQGANTRECMQSGQWSGVEPSCVRIICPTLSHPANGRVTVPNNRFVGSIATYSCNAGFRRQGANTRECMQSGQWSGVEPSCIRIICPTLSQLGNGSVTVPNNRFVGSTVTYSCNAGFRRQGANTRACMQSGEWSDVKPSCIRIICPTLSQPANGRVTVPNNRFVGSTVTYSCNAGFRRQGASTRQCMQSGQWSGVEPSCIICPTLSQPENGRVTVPNSRFIGSTASYSCNFEFTRHGTSTRECMQSGQWSSIEPSCILTDAGIYVFDSDEIGPTGFLPNNSFVVSRSDDYYGFRFRFACQSSQTGSGQIIGTGGMPLTSISRRFNVSTSQSNQFVDVLVSNRGGEGGQQPITSGNQGVYTCNLPGLDVSIGIYPNSFVKKPPHIISLTFDTTTRSFICTSTGSPATTVTWMRNKSQITDGGTYQLTQRVTNRRESTYENILTLTGVEDLDITRYECTVLNAFGDSTRVFSANVLAHIESTGTASIGRRYALICRANVSGIFGATINIQWKKQGDDQELPSQLPHTDGSRELQFSSLKFSNADRYICTVSIMSNYLNRSVMNNTDLHIQLPQPRVQVLHNGESTIYAGSPLSLTCTVTLSGKLLNDTGRHITWTGPDGQLSSNRRFTISQEALNTSSYVSRVMFDTLNTSDTGKYTCKATISHPSPYLIDSENNSSRTITINIPSPSVVITNNGSSPIYAGSVLTLTCTITLPSTIVMNVFLPVNSVIWTGPNGKLYSGNKYIISEPQQLSSSIYTSTVTFRSLQVMDSGNYSCQANASNPLQRIDDGVGLDTDVLVIQKPNLVLSLTSNMIRLPNVAPYNTFAITCTASVPLGVVSPKTFQWKRQVNHDCFEESENLLYSSNSTNIVSKELNESLSTSILSVKETMDGIWSYCCQAVMEELKNITTIKSTSITVTGSAKPHQPTNLMSTDVGTETAIVEWTVSSIAFTPESYVVHYGMSVESLLLTSDPVKSGSNFSIEDSKFSTQLSFLSPSTLYYYKVIATNTEYSTVSRIKGFRTQEDAKSDNTPTIVGGAVAGVIVVVITVSLTVIVVVWLVIKAVRQNQTRLSSASSQRVISKEIKLTHLTKSENQGSADAHYETVKEAVGKCAAYGAVGHNSEHAASAEECVYEPVLVTDGF